MTDEVGSRVESELQTLRTVLSALESVSPATRARIITYAQEAFGINVGVARPTGGREGTEIEEASARQSTTTAADIRTLKDEKKPTSAIEMAALVGYYLSELAHSRERSETVTKADITKYFKQAGFPLPAAPDMTLVQAKNAGYFDSAGRGIYRLNPVGHNLVAHGLPRQREKVSGRVSRRGAFGKGARAKPGKSLRPSQSSATTKRKAKRQA